LILVKERVRVSVLPETMSKLSRRRFISIAAAAAGLSLAPGLPGLSAAGLTRWRGRALGADAVITLAARDRAHSEALIAAARAEIERLEAIFSLFRDDSLLTGLNRQGRLNDPPFDLIELLSLAGRVHRLTGGAFDPTVQPLWAAYANRFSRPRECVAGGGEAMQEARGRIGWQWVEFGAAAIRFMRPGMGLTLNGIAQGFATDKVAELLRAGGMEQVLVEVGEIRALGEHPQERPWQVGIAAAPGRSGEAGESVELVDRAIATSAPRGTSFDPDGVLGHILDPAIGRPGGRWLQVSVLADTAALADGLSTGFCLMDEAAIAQALSKLPGTTARLVGKDGPPVRVGA
jgi:thiamine biosynthesis lipoprotein